MLFPQNKGIKLLQVIQGFLISEEGGIVFFDSI